MSTSLDEYYMEIALGLAASGRSQTNPNPMVGAVIVKNGRIVGQGAHLFPGGPHAEVHALSMAGKDAAGATVYVTLEPCSHFGRTPPCADALVKAGVGRVVIACEDTNPQVSGRGIAKLRSAGIPVDVGVLGQKAAALNETFLFFMEHQRPLVTWKAASTLDGYIAAAGGDSRYVTGPNARQQVHWLRRDLPAIAVGVGTVLADNPQLTVRLEGQGERQPLRVVFDSRLRTPSTARLLREPGSTLIYTTAAADEAAAKNIAAANPEYVRVVALEGDSQGRVPLAQALADLAKRGIDSLLVEGGSTLVSSLFRQRLVDKVVYFVAPKLLGGGIPSLAGLNPTTMGEAVAISDIQWDMVGEDLRLKGNVMYPKT